MKAILEFNMPEDRGDFEISAKALQWALAVFDVDMYLRDKLKHGNLLDAEANALQAARTNLHEILEERGLSLDDIM